MAAEQGSALPRTWRLDRIKQLAVVDAPGGAPPDFSLAEYAQQSFGIYFDELEDVVLRVRPHGADEALSWRFHPSQSITRQDDGSVLVEFRSSGMLELAWHLFTWSDKVEVLAPERLRSLLVEELRRALSAHADEAAGRAAQ